MRFSTDRPKIKLKMTSADRAIELAGLLFLLILIIVPLLWYNELPEKIPVHFNGTGTPDGYGSKITVFILPGTGLILYIVMTIVSLFPHIFNFPVKITPENAEVQYRLAVRLIRILKSTILIMFAYISFMTVKTARGSAEGLGKVFLPVFLAATFSIVIFYFVQSLGNRRKL